MRARLLTLTALAVAVMFAPTAVGADDRPTGTGGAYVPPGGDPTATASSGGGSNGGGGGGGGGDDPPCHWQVIVEDDFSFPVYSVDSLQTQHSESGRWLQYWCDDYGVVDVGGYYTIPEGGLVDPTALAQEALESVRIDSPVIRTSPSEDGRLYVHVPTWLWIDRGWWRPYTATAQAGRVWATVTAQPVSVTWDLGDGATVSCAGPGTAWTPSAGGDESACSHTYRRSTSGGALTMSATVTLEVTWTSNAPVGGELPAISRASTIDVEVGEIQAIGTEGGR